MNHQFIQNITIHWDQIQADSYLRDIAAISGVSSLAFTKPITFFVGENSSGKSTMLEAIAVASGFTQKAGQKITAFLRMIPIPNCIALLHSQKDTANLNGAISYGQRAFTM